VAGPRVEKGAEALTNPGDPEDTPTAGSGQSLDKAARKRARRRQKASARAARHGGVRPETASDDPEDPEDTDLPADTDAVDDADIQDIEESKEPSDVREPDGTDAGKKVEAVDRPLNRLGRALKKPQIAFLVVGFVFGMLVLSINPPFRVPDTILHFYKAYGISEGQVVPIKKPVPKGAKKTAGSYGPRSFDTTEKEVGLKWPSGAYNVGDVGRAMDIPLNPGKTRFYNYAHNGRIVASPLPYVPEAIILALGRLFNLSALWLVYLSSFFNLLIFLLLGYVAIKITPVLKWTFVLLGFLPTAMHLAASVSEYAVDVAVCFVGIAYFFKLAFDAGKKKVEKKDIAILFVLAFLLAMIKQPFFLIVLLFFMIPMRKFSSKKLYFGLFAALFVLALIFTLSWGLIANNAYQAPHRVDTDKRISNVFSKPGKVAGDMLGSLQDNAYMLPETMVGALGNVGQVVFPKWFVYLYLSVLVVVTLLDKDTAKVLLRQKAVALVTVLLIFVAVFLLMYVYATVNTRHAGDWLSGRYMLPAAPIFFLLFYNLAIKFKKNIVFYLAIYGFMIFTIVFTVFKLCSAYY